MEINRGLYRRDVRETRTGIVKIRHVAARQETKILNYEGHEGSRRKTDAGFYIFFSAGELLIGSLRFSSASTE